MALVGGLPPGRNIEQHDVYFGIGEHIADLVPGINKFWPGLKNKFHLDAWRRVVLVDGYLVKVTNKNDHTANHAAKLFFLNLGGYKPGEFEEFHYKMLSAATDRGTAILLAKKTAFYKHTGFKSAPSHIDEAFAVDVDDVYEINNILSEPDRVSYDIRLEKAPPGFPADEIQLGYFTIDKLKRARLMVGKDNNL